jgi:hypothetical protein
MKMTKSRGMRSRERRKGAMEEEEAERTKGKIEEALLRISQRDRPDIYPSAP